MKKILIAIVACICAVSLGCGGVEKPKDLPTLYPTTIQIVYDDGTPVDGATIALRLPKPTGGRVWNLTGMTDATGSLVLKTDGQWDGAPAGSYQVMVTKEVADIDQGGGEPGASAVVKCSTRFVDQKYNDPTTSGLTVEIKESKEGNVFELKVGEKIEEDVKVLG